MKENNGIIKTILVPVNLDDSSLVIAKQAAELAKDHGAILHLLHPIDSQTLTGYYTFTNFLRPASFVSLTNQKNNLLQTWQRSLKIMYGISITTEVAYGKWGKCILDCANEKKVDLIALAKPVQKKWWGMFLADPVERIMQDSPCQVITFFSNTESVNQWKNIVIPVAGFIPELRIKTIFRIAKNSQIKIHLVTLDNSGRERNAPQFPFIMDTLKMLKSVGNIQVQCSCIKPGLNAEHSFVDYANSIHADALMTGKKMPGSGFRKFWRNLVPRFLQFNSLEPETMYQPSI
ncbi:MAG: universal stress protein [Sediminibacterium sp.]